MRMWSGSFLSELSSSARRIAGLARRAGAYRACSPRRDSRTAAGCRLPSRLIAKISPVGIGRTLPALALRDHVDQPRRRDPVVLVDLAVLRRADAADDLLVLEVDEQQRRAAVLAGEHRDELAVGRDLHAAELVELREVLERDRRPRGRRGGRGLRENVGADERGGSAPRRARGDAWQLRAPSCCSCAAHSSAGSALEPVDLTRLGNNLPASSVSLWPSWAEADYRTRTMTRVLRCLRAWAVPVFVLGLAACSNGRGSLDDDGGGGQQQAPPKVTIGGTVAGLVRLRPGPAEQRRRRSRRLRQRHIQLQDRGRRGLAVQHHGARATGQPVAVLLDRECRRHGNQQRHERERHVQHRLVQRRRHSVRSRGQRARLAQQRRRRSADRVERQLHVRDRARERQRVRRSRSQLSRPVRRKPARSPMPAGTIGGGDVRTVKVSCATNSYTIRGTVSGLQGSGLVLQNNGGDDVGVQIGRRLRVSDADPERLGVQRHGQDAAERVRRRRARCRTAPALSRIATSTTSSSPARCASSRSAARSATCEARAWCSPTTAAIDSVRLPTGRSRSRLPCSAARPTTSR